MTDIFNPTKEEAKEAMAKGIVLPRAAQYSEGVQMAVAEQEVAALLERVKAAREKGEPIAVNDQIQLEWAKEKGLIQPEKEESTVAMISRGLQEAEYKRQDEAAAALKPLEAIATRALKARRTVIWSDFATKRAAAAQAAALEAEFDKAAMEVRDKFIRHCTTAEFRNLAEGHIAQLKQAFGEPFQEVK